MTTTERILYHEKALRLLDEISLLEGQINSLKESIDLYTKQGISSNKEKDLLYKLNIRFDKLLFNYNDIYENY